MEGEMLDCTGENCCPVDWLGDDVCDDNDGHDGCDLTCFDNDGGDCPPEGGEHGPGCDYENDECCHVEDEWEGHADYLMMMDTNEDTVVDFDELAEGLCGGSLACAEVLMVLVDNDGSWDLTHTEVSHALRALGRVACDVCAD